MGLFRVSYDKIASFHDDLAGHTGLGRRGMAPCCVQT